MRSLNDRVLQPFEKTLREQEAYRRIIGVKLVEKPTYERYIAGPLERYDRRRNAPQRIVLPDNPYTGDFMDRYKAHADRERDISELEVENRFSRSLSDSAWQLCRAYEPNLLSISSQEGRFPVHNRAHMSRLIKKVTLFFGGQIVGITKVDQRWVYKDVEIPEKYAMVIGIQHMPTLLRTGPSHMADAATGNTYSRLKFITACVADFIRRLGYPASPRETLSRKNPEMLVVPTAIDAGIGEFCRTGRCLSPEFGLNIRLKIVTTDLPLKIDKPISFGLHGFCMVCEKCAKRCPSQAIPYGPPTDKPLSISNNPGFRKWYIDAEKCFIYWHHNRRKWDECNRCVHVCPWTKPKGGIHALARWGAINLGQTAKKALVRFDDLFGYNR